MCIKNSIIFLLFIPFLSFSQIKISDIADWKPKIERAIELIKETDPNKYSILIDNCDNIEFLIGDRSTTKPPKTIVINTKDMELNSINNIASVLVHESYHLYLYSRGENLDVNEEELICYKYEYDFLCRLKSVEGWLFKNVIDMIIFYNKQ
jgi:hypothetical protein